MPEKPAEIAMLIYPGMTALDLIGPQQVFGYLPGVKVELVAKTKDVVRSDTGITIQPSKTFADCADPVDILFVGGGSDGTVALMMDSETLDFLAQRGKTAKLVTSVCTGSMVLARPAFFAATKRRRTGRCVTSCRSLERSLPSTVWCKTVTASLPAASRRELISAFASLRNCGARTMRGPYAGSGI